MPQFQILRDPDGKIISDFHGRAIMVPVVKSEAAPDAKPEPGDPHPKAAPVETKTLSTI